eukprot:GHUV01032916.1.p1 GENE.GHUV01032916.1~~GHUV01032916.1.p1  ORF type:complete len:169 (-),score=9.57 GHUV01032916.1:493-999(-)
MHAIAGPNRPERYQIYMSSIYAATYLNGAFSTSWQHAHKTDRTSTCNSKAAPAGISWLPFTYPSSGLSTYTVRLPPGFIPMTAVDRAGGGFGPEPPANSPPAVSPAFFTTTLTGCPATNSKGSAMVRFPPSVRAYLLDTASMPRNLQSKCTDTLVPGLISLPLPSSLS